MRLKTPPGSQSGSDDRAPAPGAGRVAPDAATTVLPGDAPSPTASAWDELREALRSVPGAEEAALPLFAWESPEGESIAALGIAAEWMGSASSSYVDARRASDGLLRRASDGPSGRTSPEGGAAGSLPVLFGGFPFERGDGGAPGFAGPRLFLPLRAWHVSAEGRVSEWSARRAEGAPLEAGDAGPGSNAGPGAGDRSFDREGWTLAVRRTLERIRGGRLEKAVLARSARFTAPRAVDPVRLFEALREGQPGTYRFLFRDGSGTAFAGASPERLVRLAEGLARSEAVAGTIGRSGSLEEDERLGASLLASEKDRREHDSVTREIRAAFTALCGQVEVDGGPHLLALRHLIHLRTRIHAVPRPGTHVLDFVSRLHPTPAVAGAPRAAALEWIRSVEPRPRGWYSGPVGWVNAAGEGDFAVGIRSATLHGREALLFAGAGIVAGSDPEAEWVETELKMRSMRDVLANA